jgi:Lon protease-like protein
VLPETVVFPGMTVPLYIFEARYKALVKLCLEQEVARFVIVLANPQHASLENRLPLSAVGSYVDILSVSENLDGTYHLLAYGHERCKIEVTRQKYVAEPDGAARPLYFTEDRSLPLHRSDPNAERVAAWDTREVFTRYAELFYSFDAEEQIEDAMPDDLLYQASFICANIRIPSEHRQALLETASLVDRFQLATRFMHERLAESSISGE